MDENRMNIDDFYDPRPGSGGGIQEDLSLIHI